MTGINKKIIRFNEELEICLRAAFVSKEKI